MADRELWRFIHGRLAVGERAMLMVVVESSGSSPGRAGYKMAVSADGTLTGSIGGGVMEVRLVDECLASLTSASPAVGPRLIRQTHRRDSPDPSGMICSGWQTVLIYPLDPHHLPLIDSLIAAAAGMGPSGIRITEHDLTLTGEKGRRFEATGPSGFVYHEDLTARDTLLIFGGGHCALALSEVMSRLDFEIELYDDRPALSTIDKNRFADKVTIVGSYDEIDDVVPDDPSIYVVVMTLGYASDAVVIRRLANREFRYFGVLGSRAKMATLLRELKAGGLSDRELARLRTPIGIPINSHTPEEIAISIAAEIIAVRNGAPLKPFSAMRNDK